VGATQFGNVTRSQTLEGTLGCQRNIPNGTLKQITRFGERGILTSSNCSLKIESKRPTVGSKDHVSSLKGRSTHVDSWNCEQFGGKYSLVLSRQHSDHPHQEEAVPEHEESLFILSQPELSIKPGQSRVHITV
jgi:hypothetical protein